jgi:thiol-disulfide isomerase/thioredoxin
MGRRIRTVLLPAAGVLLLTCGLALAQGKDASPAGEPPGAPEKVSLLAVGAAAPAFRLADVTGAHYSQGEEGSGKPLLLLFFSVFCDPCRAGLSVLQKIQEKYWDSRLEVAAISLDGAVLKSTVAGFAKQERYAFRVLLDEGSGRQLFRVADSYRVTEMPTVYVVDGRGRIAFAGKGRIPQETLEEAVRASLAK